MKFTRIHKIGLGIILAGLAILLLNSYGNYRFTRATAEWASSTRDAISHKAKLADYLAERKDHIFSQSGVKSSGNGEEGTIWLVGRNPSLNPFGRKSISIRLYTDQIGRVVRGHVSVRPAS